ncbi:MAG: YidC/Oxa1 family membrane protein insertase [Eggerthellaceae bacterium]|nr:YidC/Oxa1 family membrane protein insertase [Eggerthellaceae bacterium]
MWEVIKGWIFDVIQYFYNFCGDWGLAIIIVTVIFRLLMAPIMHKQAKSNHLMKKIQPKINKIQEKYADDKNRQAEEMQKIYAEAKYNPLAGCVPMLLQMPIFIALFQTLREMGVRVGDATQLTFYGIVPDLIMTPGEALSVSIGTFVPYLILMAVFAISTFVPMIISNKNNSNTEQKRQMYTMAIVMSLMMLWISWSSPAGVLLFWGVSSLLGIAQNLISTKWYEHEDKKLEAQREVLEVKPVEINVTRKEKKPRPKKKR